LGGKRLRHRDSSLYQDATADITNSNNVRISIPLPLSVDSLGRTKVLEYSNHLLSITTCLTAYHCLVSATSPQAPTMSSPVLEPTPLRASRTDAQNRGTKARPRYRACLVCSYVQPSPDWVTRGCPNCEAIVRVSSGMIAVPSLSNAI
jgi:hypothetical protein